MWNMLTRVSVNKGMLILVAAFGFIIGCVGSCSTREGTSSGGLNCRVSVPQRVARGTQSLSLILKNEGSQPLRICTACGSAMRSHKWNPSIGALEINVWLVPGGWEGDMGTVKQLKESIVTLPPGGEVGLPFDAWVDPREPIRLTAHYVVDPHVVHHGLVADPEFMKLAIWRGEIDAPPVVLRVSE